MAAPVLGSFAQQVYDAIIPLAYADDQYDYAIAKLCESIGTMFQEIEDLASDDGARPGWGILLDLPNTPSDALNWLGQFVGVPLADGLTDDQKRARIAAREGFRRGSPAAMTSAIQPYLTGSKNLVFRERDGSAYNLTVITRTTETPDVAKALAALLSQKPAGIVLDYSVLDGRSYLEVRTLNATYTIAKATYATYEHMRGTF